MNTITKVFIIINMLLALGLAYSAMTQFAYTEHWKRRWHQDTQKLAEQLNFVRDRISEHSFAQTHAETARDRIDAEYRLATAEIEQLKQQATEMDVRLTNARNEVNSKEIQIQANNRQIDSLQRSLQIARDRAAELNHIAQVSRAVAFQLNVKLAEVEDDLNNAQTAKHRLETHLQDMERQTQRKDAWLALLRTRHADIYDNITSDTIRGPEVVRGLVAAVRENPQGQQDLVMLTVRQDEMQDNMEGMEFIIYRGNEYIVKVRVVRVLDDMVACRVITDSWNREGTPIRQGDLAQNRLF